MPLEDELQALIEKRREIDRALLERHAQETAVLFTDIVGSTAFFEQRGDIEGLALVHRHNDLLFPVVSAHGGRVIKTIGDSIMAVFPSANDAVACAVGMQEKLVNEKGTAAVEKIRIRIGVHWGRVLKDGDDVFGDTVNTAARVASAAEGDEVLASQTIIDALPKGHAWLTVPRRALAAKGKSAPVPVVAVAWRNEEKENAAALAPTALQTLSLEISRGPKGLRVAAVDPDERGTVKGYADVAMSDADIERLAEPFALLAHDGGQAAYATTLAEKGRELFAKALPESVQQRLRSTQRRTIRIELEDTLVHAPWELLHDGEDFLGCRFSVGRTVSARADSPVPQPGSADAVVVVANPSGDLPDAEEEGRVVAGLLSSTLQGRVVHRSGKLSKQELIELIGRARVLHFAGHVKKDAGFVVADGVVGAEDLKPVLSKSAPAIVFANGCHASTTERWQDAGASSLAQALLLSGVRHTLAPLWGVPDADALAFALRFYEHALQGLPLGECARRARKALALTHRAPLSFAGYVLYGEPRALFPLDDARPLPNMGRTRSGDIPRVDITTTAPTPAPSAPAPPVARASAPATTVSPLILGAAGGLLVGVAVIAAIILKPEPAAPPVTAVVVPDKPAPAGKLVHQGPVRISVMPFKSTGAPDATLDFLQQGLTEVVVTELGGGRGNVQIIERGQIDVDVKELDFQQSKYIDAATRAQLGKIGGAEVAVLGAYQLGGEQLRFTARFVDVETGEVLATAKADGPRADVFALQDKLSAEVKTVMNDVAKRMRP
jgi:class 3 adenylate cyclase/TolB-like protein/CHAT domain-containing protein